jgi:hypothetical protein
MTGCLVSIVGMATTSIQLTFFKAALSLNASEEIGGLSMALGLVCVWRMIGEIKGENQ